MSELEGPGVGADSGTGTASMGTKADSRCFALFFDQSLGGTRGSRFHRDRGNEPVAAARHGFKKSRIRRAVSERLADLQDRNTEALIKIHEGVPGPQPLTHFLARHNLAALLEQQGE